jgi:hypothetical protein
LLAEISKTFEVAVSGAEYQSVLNGQRNEIGIRYQVRLHSRGRPKESSKGFAVGYCEDFSNIVHIGSPARPKIDRTRLKTFALSRWPDHTLNTLSEHQIKHARKEILHFAFARTAQPLIILIRRSGVVSQKLVT